MSYRGNTAEREQARQLRAEAWTLREICDELGVSKASVSIWVRDVDFEPQPRRTARRRAPNALQRRKAAEIEELVAELQPNASGRDGPHLGAARFGLSFRGSSAGRASHC